MSLDKFAIPTKAIQRDGSVKTVPVYYAFLKVPTTMLEVMIPEEATVQVYGEPQTMNLGDFALNVLDLGDDSVISVSASHSLGNKSRVWWTTEADIQQWLGFLEPFGFTVDDLLTLEEYKELKGE